MATSHPYMPSTLVLDGYFPEVLPYHYILTVFFAVFGFLAVATYLWTGTYKRLTAADRALATWFVCTGLIHLVVEGSVVLNSNFYKDSSGNILNEIWKEYAKADSRYATRDPFVIQVEGFTAFVEGPSCFIVLYAILGEASWRYTAILLVSFGQLYGDILYFLTSFHTGEVIHTRPEFLYFWVYFVGMNAIWLVIPFFCIWHSVTEINKAVLRSSTRKNH